MFGLRCERRVGRRAPYIRLALLSWLGAGIAVSLVTTVNGASPDNQGLLGAYVSAGCVACHGSEAQGAKGPRLSGTTRKLDWFIRYVRDPAGQMPAFGTDQISDQDLAVIWNRLAAVPRH